jgi:lipid-A-disaccharide synthase
MRPKVIMVVAGDPSGDANAAELVKSLGDAIPRSQFFITNEMQPLTATLRPRFIGAGGPRMAGAGVSLSFNLTDDAVFGPTDVIAKIGVFRRRLKELLQLALQAQPDVIILVDFQYFNQLLAHGIRERVRHEAGTFANWQPKIVQYTSPQVWASRPWRAKKLAEDRDLLLCLFPFEKEWYARRGLPLRVEYAGHPILDKKRLSPSPPPGDPIVALLPGSRRGELKRHLPVLLQAAHEITAHKKVRFTMVATNERLADYARSFQVAGMPKVEIQVGHLSEALSTATVAIASTGTVTLECAYYGLPTVALYKTSAITAFLGRRLATVKYAAMPNLLADEMVFPEFIQNDATAQNIATAALDLLENPSRREEIRDKLAKIIASLGPPGSIERASAAIIQLMGPIWNPDFKASLANND